MGTFRGQGFQYDSPGGGRCGIRTTRMQQGYAAIIDWPAGCQGFPDVLRTYTLEGLPKQLRVAQAMVRKLGFAPVA